MNIFYRHFKRRDGAIFKDLAFLTHNERIDYLNNAIFNSLKMLEKNASRFRFAVNSLAYYQRLKSYCLKNNHIKAM